ncbi:MAG TPA: ABC transporter permease [Gemmatimonadaceae bacterium]|nr:ABC transporter permease [Gemmatimonadaceae bacterium]
MIDAAKARLRALFRRGAVDREMRDEMAMHLQQATERLMARGLSEADARDLARREFGNVAVLQEEGRDARGARWLEILAADVRFALRHFGRTPLTAVTLILVLALGIGVNSALFSVLQMLTMRPAPAVPADDALVRIRGTTFSRMEGQLRARRLSMPEVNDLASRRATFSAVAGYAVDQMVLDPGDGSDLRPDEVQFVTPNFFSTLRVRPAFGPGLPAGSARDTPGTELVAVMSHGLWEKLGSDSALVGRIVRINDVPVRVVGVAPPAFEGPVIASGTPSVWVPIAARAALMRSSAHALASRDSTFMEAFARLAPNVTVEQANAVVRVVATSWVPEKRPDGAPLVYSSDVVRLRGFTDVSEDDEGILVAGLFGIGALLVLLVACTNVSALLVGAAVARRREIAIRLSLGASRLRVIRQLVTETSLIAFAGGACGLALFWAIMRALPWLVGDIAIGPDLGTVGFTALFALGTGIVFGLSPALHATRLDVSSALKDTGGGGTSRSRLQRTFIVAQIVLTQPLLVGIAMVVGIVFSEVGGGAENPLADKIVRVEFGTWGGAGTRDEKFARIADVMQKVAALPGVEAVVPQAAAFDIGDFRVHPEDRGAGPRAQETVRTQIEGTPPGYFAFQSARMLRGREFVATDTAGGNMPVVISLDLARGFWGAADPIGRRMQLTLPEMVIVEGNETSKRVQQPPRTAVVVGVFDTTTAPLRRAGRVYTADGSRWQKATYLVRTRGQGTGVIPDIRRIARAGIPDIPIYRNGLATLEQLARSERSEMMQVSVGAAGGGLLALLLTSIGLYGVVALAVRQRHREIGIRVSLGARPRQVVGMFFMSGIRLSILGVVLGLPFSVFALYTLATKFATTVPLDMPLVGLAVALAVVGVAAFASWLPARRAAGVDPLVAMRTE